MRVRSQAGLWMSGAIVAAALALGCGRETTVAEDAAVQSRVEQELAGRPDLQGARIDVEAEDGRVTLRGEVPGEEQRDRAEEIAEQVAGVDSVDSELRVAGEAATPPVGGGPPGGAENPAERGDDLPSPTAPTPAAEPMD